MSVPSCPQCERSLRVLWHPESKRENKVIALFWEPDEKGFSSEWTHSYNTNRALVCSCGYRFLRTMFNVKMRWNNGYDVVFTLKDEMLMEFLL